MQTIFFQLHGVQKATGDRATPSWGSSGKIEEKKKGDPDSDPLVCEYPGRSLFTTIFSFSFSYESGEMFNSYCVCVKSEGYKL